MQEFSCYICFQQHRKWFPESLEIWFGISITFHLHPFSLCCFIWKWKGERVRQAIAVHQSRQIQSLLCTIAKKVKSTTYFWRYRIFNDEWNEKPKKPHTSGNVFIFVQVTQLVMFEIQPIALVIAQHIGSKYCGETKKLSENQLWIWMNEIMQYFLDSEFFSAFGFFCWFCINSVAQGKIVHNVNLTFCLDAFFLHKNARN